MPGAVRKLLVIAAADALFLQPHVHRSQKPSPSISLAYGNKDIDIKTATGSLPGRDSSLPSIEAHGIVGLFTIASSSYLILITNRKQVAQISRKPIYVISGVTLVPLASFAEAKSAIENSKKALEKGGLHLESDTSDDEEENPDLPLTGETDDISSPVLEKDAILGSKTKDSSSIVQDVISKKGAYGRFAERWFSRKGWSAERRRSQGMSTNAAEIPVKFEAQQTSSDLPPDNPAPPEEAIEDSKLGERQATSIASVTATLAPKLVRTTRLLLNSQSFYFSYDYDLTRRLGSGISKGSDILLCKRVDPLFFWNQHLTTCFAEAGQHHFILPVLQGFVAQRAFTIDTKQSSISDTKENIGEVIELQDNANGPENFTPSTQSRDYLVTLISRRSTGRPGLRYLRRGVDDEGHTANFVETEQIFSSPSWSSQSKIYSFTQIRGSIPLFFSQSPYTFKPVPILQHSFDINQTAFRKHFSTVIHRYGSAQVALLVDKHGSESKIGEQYEQHTAYLNDHNGINGKKVGFEWFDFHYVCRGMKFENVSLLMDALDKPLRSFGFSIESDDKLIHSQSGILRTSCMDCLDRTNVVQSACGRWALQEQLQQEGITLDLQGDVSTRWFDIMWADNGDAISKQYASTAALKGDYTRTRKRDYRGALNDFGLTLGRYYNNIVNDYFSQAAIDFLLGRVSDEVFEEFEANMMSGDPGMSVSKVRQNAVDISVKIVVEDQTEEFRGGWAMITPHVSNSLRSFPMEEMVLLITNVALYAVRFNWATEKVKAFERIEAKDITRIYRGTYITNTLSALQSDPKRNVGFVVEYKPGVQSVARINTRSMSTAAGMRDEEARDALEADPAANKLPGTFTEDEVTSPGAPIKEIAGDAPTQVEADTRILAFKAVPAGLSPRRRSQDSVQGQEMNEGELVKNVCDELMRMAGKTSDWVEEKDIISLAEAKKSTGLIEQWSHSLKKLVWA